MRRQGSTYILAVALALAPLASFAQQPAEQTATPPWPKQSNSSFVSGQLDAGFLFLRPRFHLGYGRAHHQWMGIEANPILAEGGSGAYMGLRAAMPYVDLRVGGRYQRAFSRSFLTPQETFDHLDLQSRIHETSSYLSLETQLTTNLPLGPGNVQLELTATSVQLVPEEFFVFEETLKVIVDPPYVGAGSIAYLFRFAQNLGKAGPVFEAVNVPARELLVLRGGIIITMQMWPQIQARAKFIPVLKSRDAIGLSGGDSVLVGVRYKWAQPL